MKPVIIIVASLILLIGSVFGYYLFKSNGDFVLAQAMISYEVNALIGESTSETSQTQSSADTETADIETANVDSQTTPTSTHTKDSIYKGNGNSFSDVKKTGSESSYQPKQSN